jgi:hypothetical protein
MDNLWQWTTRSLCCWDIFCQVIDNHGDIGVCWRLACRPGARGQAVRLWVDWVEGLAAKLRRHS